MSTTKTGGVKPIEIKPTTFANGVPKEEHNGFYGEGKAEQILALPMGTQITAVVTYVLDDDIVKKGKGVRYAVLKATHIEPIFDEERKAAVEDQRDDEYSDRTGADQLDFSGVAEGGE